MGQLSLADEKSVKGPWLIGAKELEELDKVLESVISNVFSSRKKQLEFEAHTYFEQGQYETLDKARVAVKRFQNDKVVRKFELRDFEGKKLIDSSLVGLLKDPKLADFKPVELSIDIYSGGLDNRFWLRIGEAFLTNSLTYRLNCFDADSQSEIIFLIEKWIESNRAKKVVQYWRSYAFGIGLIALFFCISFGKEMIRDVEPSVKELYTSEMNEILNKGISETNEHKALELLLRYTIDNKPQSPNKEREWNQQAVWLFLISFFILVLSVHRPKTVIGLGRLKGTLKKQKTYIHLVILGIPSVIFFPLIYDLFKKFLSMY